jgi:hypothetical protein
MQLKLCRAQALLVLLALSGAANAMDPEGAPDATASLGTTIADAVAIAQNSPSAADSASWDVASTDVDEYVAPVETAEWAYNSSALLDSDSSTTSVIDPSVAPARSGDPTAKPTPAPDQLAPPHDEAGKASGQDVPYHWLDTTRRSLYNTLWKSAAHVDRWFGSSQDDTVYQKVYGSIAPAMLYSQYDGLRTQVRFNMNFPFPEANDRLHAFVGRFDPNEFITERDEPSGAIPRTYGPPTEDQTLLGIGYRQPDRQGSRFDAGAGIRLGFPMDPYIKGSYIYERGRSETGLFSVRETLFWQNSDGAGETTRLDLERIFYGTWLARYTISATRSQMSQGLRGYTSALLLHGLPGRRAVAFEVGSDGQSEAPVQLHDYGFKAAYRQGILRRWLIMEIRTSVDWPRDYIYQRRTASFGVGIGFEMLLGTEDFLARPITF